MPKYLDQNGLTTFKSKLDTTYAKKNDVYDKTAADGLLSAKANSSDVYTKAQVDSAIADAGGLPTITIAVSQVISQDPLQIQLTDEQFATMNGHSVIVDASALGMPTVVADYSGQYTDTDNEMDYLNFVFIYPEDYKEMFHFRRIFVNVSTKVAEISITYPQYADQAAEANQAHQSDYADTAYSVNYTTTEPVTILSDNELKIAVLDHEPSQRVSGWLYIITESN